MTALLPLVAACVGIVTVTTLLRALMRQWSPATRSFALGAAMLTLAVPMQTEPFSSWLGPIAWPLQHVLALGTAYLVPAGFAHATDDAPTRFLRARWYWLWVAIAIVVVTFLIAPDATDWSFAPSGRYRAGGPGHPAGQVAYIAFGAYLAHAVATLFVLSRRAARLADAVGHRWLARGMRIHAAGELPVLTFSLHMVVYNTALLLGFVPPWPEARVDDLLIPIGSGTVLLGLAVSAFATVAQAPRDWWRYDRHRLVIYPLWTSVTTAIPASDMCRSPRRAGGRSPDRAGKTRTGPR